MENKHEYYERGRRMGEKRTKARCFIFSLAIAGIVGGVVTVSSYILNARISVVVTTNNTSAFIANSAEVAEFVRWRAVTMEAVQKAQADQAEYKRIASGEAQ